MKKCIISFFVASSFIAATTAYAQTMIMFPIPELGNCANKDACRMYCDDNSHLDACMKFAQTHGLMSKDETTLATQIRRGGGPGGCTTKESCMAYCAEESHVQTCLHFGVTHKLISQDAASTTSQFEQLIKSGGGPGGCTTTQECKAFCSNPANMQVCMQFEQDHGFMRVKNEMDREGSSTMSTSTMLFGMPKPKFDTSKLKGLCNSIDSCRQVCAKNPALCIGMIGSSTRNVPPPIIDTRALKGKCFSQEDCLRLINQMQGSTTMMRPTPHGVGEDHRNVFMQASTTTSGGGQPTPANNPHPEMNKPPYHCTPGQAAEGACDPDQFPGYQAPTTDENNNLGGAVMNAVLHFFGF